MQYLYDYDEKIFLTNNDIVSFLIFAVKGERTVKVAAFQKFTFNLGQLEAKFNPV